MDIGDAATEWSNPDRALAATTQAGTPSATRPDTAVLDRIWMVILLVDLASRPVVPSVKLRWARLWI